MHPYLFCILSAYYMSDPKPETENMVCFLTVYRNTIKRGLIISIYRWVPGGTVRCSRTSSMAQMECVDREPTAEARETWCLCWASIWDVLLSSEAQWWSKVVRSAEAQSCSTQYVSQLFIIETNTPQEITYKRKYLLWVMASEESVHDQLAPLLLGCGPAERYGRRAKWRKAAHHTAARQQGEWRKGAGSRCNLQRHASVICFLQLSPVFYIPTASKYNTQIWDASVD